MSDISVVQSPFDANFVPKCNASFSPTACTRHVCNRPSAHPADFCQCHCGVRLPHWRDRPRAKADSPLATTEQAAEHA